eukprot:scaffold61434_cov32-Prasinocladus_malaysianus.AAC.1
MLNNGHSPEVMVNSQGCYVAYIPNVLSAEGSRSLFEALATEVAWARETDSFGPQDRLTAYMADPGCTFTYVGLTLPPSRWHPKTLQYECRRWQSCERNCPTSSRSRYQHVCSTTTKRATASSPGTATKSGRMVKAGWLPDR